MAINPIITKSSIKSQETHFSTSHSFQHSFAPPKNKELFYKLLSKNLIDETGTICKKHQSKCLPQVDLSELKELMDRLKNPFTVKIGDQTLSLSMKEVLNGFQKDPHVSKILLIGSDGIFRLFQIPGYIEKVFKLFDIEDLFSEDLIVQDYHPIDIDIRVCLNEQLEWNKKTLSRKRDEFIQKIFPGLSLEKIKNQAFTQLETFDNGLNAFQIFHIKGTPIEMILSGNLCRKSVFTLDDINIPFLDSMIQPEGHYGDGLQSIFDYLFGIVRLAHGFPDARGWFRLQGQLIKGYQPVQFDLEERLFAATKGSIKTPSKFASEMRKWQKKHFAHTAHGSLAYTLQVCQHHTELPLEEWKKYIPNTLPSHWGQLENFSPKQIFHFLPILAYLKGEEGIFHIKKYSVSLLVSIENALIWTFEKKEGEKLGNFLRSFLYTEDSENKIDRWIIELLDKNQNRTNKENSAFLLWKIFQDPTKLWQTLEWLPVKIFSHPGLVTRILILMRKTGQFKDHENEIFAAFVLSMKMLFEKRESLSPIYLNLIIQLSKCLQSINLNKISSNFDNREGIFHCIDLLIHFQDVPNAQKLLEIAEQIDFFTQQQAKAKQKWNQIVAFHLKKLINTDSSKIIRSENLHPAQDLIHSFVSKGKLTQKGAISFLLQILHSEIHNQNCSKTTLDLLFSQIDSKILDKMTLLEINKTADILLNYLSKNSSIQEGTRIALNRIFAGFILKIEDKPLSIKLIQQIKNHNLSISKEVYSSFWCKVLFRHSFEDRETLYSFLLEKKKKEHFALVDKKELERFITNIIEKEVENDRILILMEIYFSTFPSPSEESIPLLRNKFKILDVLHPQLFDWISILHTHDNKKKEFYLELIYQIYHRTISNGKTEDIVKITNMILNSEILKNLPLELESKFFSLLPSSVDLLCKQKLNRIAFKLITKFHYFQDFECLSEIVSFKDDHLFKILETEELFKALKNTEFKIGIYLNLLENIFKIINQKTSKKRLNLIATRFDELSQSIDELTQFKEEGEEKEVVLKLPCKQEYILRFENLEINMLLEMVKIFQESENVKNRLTNYYKKLHNLDKKSKTSPLLYQIITNNFSEEFVFPLLGYFDINDINKNQITWELFGKISCYLIKKSAKQTFFIPVLMGMYDFGDFKIIMKNLKKSDIKYIIQFLDCWKCTLSLEYQKAYKKTLFQRAYYAVYIMFSIIDKLNILHPNKELDALFNILIDLFLQISIIQFPDDRNVIHPLYERFFSMPIPDMKKVISYLRNFCDRILQAYSSGGILENGDEYSLMVLYKNLKVMESFPDQKELLKRCESILNKFRNPSTKMS